METRNKILSLLTATLQKEFPNTRLENEKITIPEIMITLTIDQNITQQDNRFSVGIQYSLNHQTFFNLNMCEYSYGVDEVIDAAITKSINAWIDIDFAVIKNAIRSCQQRQSSSNGQKSINIFLSAFYLNNEQKEPVDQTATTILDWLSKDFNDEYVCKLKTDEAVFLKYIASKYPDNRLGIDCRVNGKDWDKGKQILAHILQNHLHTNSHFIMVKQGILFYPLP